MFAPVLTDYLQRYPQGPLTVAFDDTKLPKTGKKIPTAFWQRHPLLPPFRINLLYGLRFLQASRLFPHYQEGDFSARAFPVRFHEVPAVDKPGRRASEQAQQEYRRLQKLKNLSTQSLAVVHDLRAQFDALGAAARLLLLALDGSFCNQTFFKASPERTELLARARKDARLCFPAPPGSRRRRYAAEIFTPEQVRQDEARPWQRAKVYFGGQWREVRYKDVPGLRWRRGAGPRPLRLLVVAPLPYRVSPHARLNYRQPAYLLTTDLASGAASLLQLYLDRWQTEVNHRHEKSLLGVGQAQVRSALSVPRQPALVVASYSLLLLAALQAFGPGRTSDYLPLPKWRKPASRPSLLDILNLLRHQINETSVSGPIGAISAETLMHCAYT